MRKGHSILAGLLLLAGGAAVVIVADRQGWLPGSQPADQTQSCLHSLGEGDCPFCDRSLVETMGQCVAHGVPEALCTKCNSALIAGFKAESDWCGGHNIPESQCTLCNPGLLAGKASLPTATTRSASEQLAPVEEDVPRSRRAPSATCTAQERRIRFSSPDTAREAGLETVTVQCRAITETLGCSAEIEFDGNRCARLSSRVSTVVHEVKADMGEAVRSGAVLAVLNSADLGSAKADYLKLRETVDIARLKAEGAQDYFERMNRLEVRMTALDYLEARQLLEVAGRNFKREQDLISRGATSEKEMLDERASFLRAEADVKALRGKLILFGVSASELDALTWETATSISGLGSTSDRELLEARISFRAAEADLETARNRLRILGLSREDIERVAREQDTSSLLALVAPFEGQVVERHAVIGEVVDSSKVLFVVADTSRMWAMLDVYEADVSKIRVGQSVGFAVEGLRGETFGGLVTGVNAYLDRRTRTLKVRAEIANPRGLLRAGMFGRAVITISDREDLLVVPKSAVQWEGCCNVVFVKHSDVLFVPRKVRLGYETDGVFVVEDGLKGGEAVVTTGSFLLKTEILKGSIGAGCCPETKRDKG